MMRMKLDIRESNVYCEVWKDDTDEIFVDLRAERLKDTWFVTSSTHADSEALNDFEASDQWIAAPMLIGIARRLNQRILAGKEE